MLVVAKRVIPRPIALDPPSRGRHISDLSAFRALAALQSTMSSRLHTIASRQLSRLITQTSKSSPCLICRYSSASPARQQSRRAPVQAQTKALREQRRCASTETASSTAIETESLASDTAVSESKPLTLAQAVSELRTALLDLQRDAGSYTNISRLQLALRSIEAHDGQQLGHETIRVAIVALSGQGYSGQKARELVRLLLADPLKEEEDWETSLVNHKGPILLRIGQHNEEQVEGQNRLIKELNISSPTLNGHQLEILVLDGEVLGAAEESVEDVADRLLTPIIDIPVSTTGRYSPITTPVHKTLIVGDGINGGATLLKLPIKLNRGQIASTVDLPGFVHEENASLPIQPMDLRLGGAALGIFRQSVERAMDYEEHWTASNLPLIQQWLKSGTSPSQDMKEPTETLITSLLEGTEHRISRQEAQHLASVLSSRLGGGTVEQLQKDLTTWSENAHTELRDSLDAAFAGPHWNALSWWKLFWRVDDISAITSDMVNSRFLQNSEDELIYLSGKLQQAGVFSALPFTSPIDAANQATNMKGTHGGAAWAYVETPKQAPNLAQAAAAEDLNLRKAGEVVAATPTTAPLEGAVAVPAIKASPWPLHIAVTRRGLSTTTIPRLQALAQGLVAQTVATSFAATSFSALIYATNLSVGLYEAGAVAALGTVLSMGRMQKRWEGARKWWEGEAREEGRRALVFSESIVRDVLQKAAGERPAVENREIGVAKEAVARARAALEGVKRVTEKKMMKEEK